MRVSFSFLLPFLDAWTDEWDGTVFIGSGTAILISETVLDGDYTRFALLVTAPFLFCISLFFCLQMFGNLTMMCVPFLYFA